MTRKHFDAVAEMFRTNRPSTGVDSLWAARHSGSEIASEVARQEGAREQWDTCVEDFANLAATWNPNFDRARFFRACGR